MTYASNDPMYEVTIEMNKNIKSMKFKSGKERSLSLPQEKKHTVKFKSKKEMNRKFSD